MPMIFVQYLWWFVWPLWCVPVLPEVARGVLGGMRLSDFSACREEENSYFLHGWWSVLSPVDCPTLDNLDVFHHSLSRSTFFDIGTRDHAVVQVVRSRAESSLFARCKWQSALIFLFMRKPFPKSILPEWPHTNILLNRTRLGPKEGWTRIRNEMRHSFRLGSEGWRGGRGLSLWPPLSVKTALRFWMVLTLWRLPGFLWHHHGSLLSCWQDRAVDAVVTALLHTLEDPEKKQDTWTPAAQSAWASVSQTHKICFQFGHRANPGNPTR